MEQKDKRSPVIFRTYEKGSDQRTAWIYQLTGEDIHGSVFEFVVLLNNQEEPGTSVVSGNMFHIRATFVNYLLNLNDDGWKRTNYSGPMQPEHSKFFDPEQL